MASMREKCIDWAIALAEQGDRWWMPLVLLAVVTVNSLTGGAFIWCIGPLQASLFPVVVLSNKQFGVLLGPIVMTLGSSIAAVTYIQLMKTSGADALLESTGAKGSAWLEQAQTWASSYGAVGLLVLQIAPVPIPTAVCVVAGMLAKIDEFTVLVVLMTSKFVQLMVGAVALKYGLAEGQTAAEYLRQQFKNEETDKKPQEEKKDK
mmetsp:Transcript_84959/g.243834  ORF Transcript_84959/g.243834 Transcript_84959/m.243834 type:complete len:206 (-) Transcript_84959:81-698(-)